MPLMMNQKPRQMETSARKPNIIIYIMDDIGANDVSTPRNLNLKQDVTPNLYTMLHEGVFLERFYCPQSICSPTRMSVMTGAYPERYNIGDGVLWPNDVRGLDSSIPNIASLCKSAGYNTAYFGKWHLGDHPDFLPNAVGFDYFYGIPTSWGMTPDFPGFNFPELPLSENGVETTTYNPVLLGDMFEKKAVTWQRNQEKHYLLVFGSHYAHTPHYVPHNWLERADYDPYKAAIMHMDDILGSLITWGDENTLVIVISDNGADIRFGSNAPYSGGKHNSEEGGIRVPAYAMWPRHFAKNKVLKRTTSAMDIFPTIAHTLNTPISALSNGKAMPIDGISILDFLQKPDEWNMQKEERVLWHYHKGSLNAVTMGNLKFYPYEFRLHNTCLDPGETVNLYNMTITGVIGEETMTRLNAIIAQAIADLGDKRTGVKVAKPYTKNLRSRV